MCSYGPGFHYQIGICLGRNKGQLKLIHGGDNKSFFCSEGTKFLRYTEVLALLNSSSETRRIFKEDVLDCETAKRMRCGLTLLDLCPSLLSNTNRSGMTGGFFGLGGCFGVFVRFSSRQSPELSALYGLIYYPIVEKDLFCEPKKQSFLCSDKFRKILRTSASLVHCCLLLCQTEKKL